MTLGKKSLVLIVLAVTLSAFPLALHQSSEFSGADGEAEEAIMSIKPSYQPWVESIWEPPGGETESLLFALQAALGAGFLGYYIGFKKGKVKEQDK